MVKNYQKQREIIMDKLEHNSKLYTKFKKWLDKEQDLDIEFVLYEDSIDYPKETIELYKLFKKESEKLKEKIK